MLTSRQLACIVAVDATLSAATSITRLVASHVSGQHGSDSDGVSHRGTSRICQAYHSMAAMSWWIKILEDRCLLLAP